MTGSALEVTGMAEFDRALSGLSLYVESDVLRQAAWESMAVLEAEAKSLAPVKTGQLQRAVKRRRGRGGKGRFAVLVSAADEQFFGDEYYAAFIEFGWKAGKRPGRRTAAEADNRRQIPGEHFIRIAADEVADRVLSSFIAAGMQGIDAIMTKQP